MTAPVENARPYEESARFLAEVHQLQRTGERFFAMNHELRNAAAFRLSARQHAIALIDDLLDLSRLDVDHLNPMIRGGRANSPSQSLHVPYDPRGRPEAGDALPCAQLHPSKSCDTDANRVEQMLVSLLGNAIK
jgi:signal transduction histidine kinase